MFCQKPLIAALIAGLALSSNPTRAQLAHDQRAAATADQQPTFKSGIDLVSIDVAVLDKTGAPVPALGPDDFIVTAGRKSRRIVGVDFVTSASPSRAADFRTAPAASGNRRLVAPRTVIFLVDMEQVPAGGGRTVMKGLAEYLDKLSPQDRVGVMTLMENRVAPTTDRPSVRSAVINMVGSSPRLRDREMTFGEAPGIAGRDRLALMAYWRRIADQGVAAPGDQTCMTPAGFDAITNVPAACTRQAETALERFRFDTRRVLSRIAVIAEAMATVPDPKAIVLVSGGLYGDQQTQNAFLETAGVAERARVSVSALLLEADATAGGSSSTDTRRLDGQAGYGGLADLTTLARGSTHRVISDPGQALLRVDRELSGYYVLSFERDPADRENERLELEVRTKRPETTVRYRKSIRPGATIGAAAPNAATSDLKAGVAALLRSGSAVTQVPLEVDAYALPVAASGNQTRIVVSLDIGREADKVAAVGFQLAEGGGKVVGDGFGSPPQLMSLGLGRSGYVASLDSPGVGRFIVRVGVIDADGRRGSIQHTFDLAPWEAGPVRVSDLMFGTIAGGEFMPAAVGPGAASLGLRVVVRDASQKFESMRVRMSVVRASDGAPVDMVDAPLRPTPDPVRRFADAAVNIEFYPPGEYAITAVVTAGGKEIGRRTRVLVR